jgi:tetratricopeptide (TPR) repeat protein
LLHSIGKPKSGWSADEIKTAQSPETMSLMVDDIDPLLVPARRRMAAQLGLEPESSGEAASGGDPMAQRAAGELADAEARLQRAQARAARRLGPFYRQIGAIHIRQRNFAAARAWLEKGMAIDAEDPWCRYEYAGLLMAENELDRAAEAADAALALALASDNAVSFHRRRADIEARRGNLAGAEALLSEIAARDPENPWPHFDLAALHLRQGDLDAAARAADVALERSPVPSSALLRRRAEVELRRGDRAAAARLFEQARAIDPRDASNYYHLARLEMAEGRHEAAIGELEAGLALRSPLDALLHRSRSEIEMQRGQRAQALAAANRAISADPEDTTNRLHLSGVLQAIGDLDGAAEAAAEATRLARSPSPVFYRRQANIEAHRGDPAAALAFLDQALAAAPNEPAIWLDISAHRLALNDPDGADEAAVLAGAALPQSERAPVLRRRAQIASRRNDAAAARAFLSEAMTLAPTDPGCRADAANQSLAEGDADTAAAWIREAIDLSAAAPKGLLRLAAGIEERRRNWEAAQDYLRQAIDADPNDPQLWTKLADLRAKNGDLAAAQQASERAMSLASGGGASLAAT